MRRGVLPQPIVEWGAALAGHVWTVLPELHHRVRPVRLPPTDPLQVDLVDPRLGTVRLRGWLHHAPGATTLLVVVHGLGGSTDSPYCRRVASRAHARGWSTLRLGLRGSAGDGEDLYHAGLGSDLTHALRHPEVLRYARVLVVGYSLGGHVALDHALDPEVGCSAVAAISSPLDLDRSCRAIDRRRGAVYRHHVLRGLKESYREVAKRRPLPTAVEQVDRVTTIRQWDRLTVVPRFGFDSVDHYYRTVSVGPRLRALPRPVLYVGMRHDPMVPPWTVEPSLERASPRLEVRWLDAGGHVAAPGAWEEQMLDWLDRHGAPTPG